MPDLRCGCWNSRRRKDSIEHRREKEKGLSLYQEGEYQASSAWPFGTFLKSRSHTSGHDWVTHTRIDENPVIRGTRSLLRQDVAIKLPRNTCSGRLGKTVRHDRTTAERHAMKSCQQIRFVETLYSLWWYVEFILQSRTRSLCSKSSMEYSEEEPALQCRRQSARRTHRH